MDIRTSEDIVAEQDGNGTWCLKEIKQSSVSSGLFISIPIILNTLALGYITWDGEPTTMLKTALSD